MCAMSAGPRVVRWQVRLLLLVVLAGAAAAFTWKGARQAQRTYEEELEQLADAPYREAWLAPATAARRGETLARMREHDALLLEWSILMLAAVAALATTSKVHRVAQFETLYVLLAPAAILLLGSVHQGIRFQRRVAFMFSRDLIHPPAVTDSLYFQGEMLFWALACLTLFVVVFYLMIVFGRVRPMEDTP